MTKTVFELREAMSVKVRKDSRTRHLDFHDDNKKIGSAEIEKQKRGDDDSVHVHYFGIDKEHRGKGYGTKAYGHLLNHIRKEYHPSAKYVSGDITNRHIDHIKRHHLGPPVKQDNGIRDITDKEAHDALPDHDNDEYLGAGNHVFQAHRLNHRKKYIKEAWKSYRSNWHGKHGEYDDDYHDQSIDKLEHNGKTIAFRHKLTPKPHTKEWVDDVVKPESGVIHRGMSHKEYKSIKKHGEIKSKGDYNIGDEQKGLTYYSKDTDQAGSYAHGFAPDKAKPNKSRNAYVVSVKKPDDSDIKHVDGTGSNEVGVKRPVNRSDIMAVHRARATSQDHNGVARVHWSKVDHKNLEEMAPPHVERDEVVKHLIKRGLRIKRQVHSGASDSEYIHVDVGDEHDEHGDKIGDKLLKVRFSDHPDRRGSSAKFAPADVEVGSHGLPVHHAIKHILRHAGIHESTTKQHINYQMLSNYSLGQRARYHDKQAELELARRQRLGDHNDQMSLIPKVHGGDWNTYTKTDTPMFKKWFGDSKVVDDLGQPLVLYHGTVRDFYRFDKKKTSKESNIGGGHYFSNSTRDSSRNYASVEGGDLKSKISTTMDKVHTDLTDGDDDDEHITDTLNKYGIKKVDDDTYVVGNERFDAWGVAMHIAKKIHIEHEGAILPVYLSIQKPFVIGGPNKTIFPYETSEKYGLPIGAGVDFIDIFMDELERYEDTSSFDGEAIVTDLHTLAQENGGIEYDAFMSIIRGMDISVVDEDGAHVFGQVVQDTLKRMGYDGIIDHTVSAKFRSMNKPDDVHYIVFDDNQIKSAIGNRGWFDRDRPEITEEIKHVNYQMLSNYSLGQRVRYNDQLAAFEVARRNRMKDHQIQHHPSMRMMPTQSRSETNKKPEVLGKKAAWVREKIDVVAEQYGYPKNKIFMSDEQYDFNVGGKSYTSGGVAYLNDHPDKGRRKGDIVIYGKPDFENDLPIRGIMAHEISHQKFNTVMEQYHEEYKEQSSRNFENRKLKPEFNKIFPITAALSKTKLLTDAMVLVDSDGVSGYSMSYWNDFYSRPAGNRQRAMNLAIDETIAEIARLDEEVGIKKTINPAVFYRKATEFLNNHFKDRFEKHGVKFATKYEYDSIQRDPWSHLELADTEDFKKEFGVYPRSIRVNHIQKRVTVQDDDPFFKPAKVKPEWVKLYNTINELCEKLKDKKKEMPEYPFDGAHSA